MSGMGAVASLASWIKTGHFLYFSSENILYLSRETPKWNTNLKAANLIILVQEAPKALEQVRP